MQLKSNIEPSDSRNYGTSCGGGHLGIWPTRLGSAGTTLFLGDHPDSDSGKEKKVDKKKKN